MPHRLPWDPTGKVSPPCCCPSVICLAARGRVPAIVWISAAANDTPTLPNRVWGLPDLNIGGAAQTVSFSQTGELTVFSTDHPNSVQAVALPFNFRTFEGQVSVDVKVCPESGSAEKVVVITGKSRIALPGLGSETNPSTMINAEFILCETALRKVLLSFSGPPDIPAGSTGILVNYVEGDVLIGPPIRR